MQETPTIPEPSPHHPPTTPPFIIAVTAADAAQTDPKHSATLQITPELRTSGLLENLPALAWKNLLRLLTFASPPGVCQATLTQVAQAMHVPEAKARTRMQRLLACAWNGRSLLSEHRQQNGQTVYILSPALYTVRSVTIQTPMLHVDNQAPEEGQVRMQTSSPTAEPMTIREAVIAHSRSRYATPRAEVERMIARQMGWSDPTPAPPPVLPGRAPAAPVPSPVDAAKADVRRRLIEVGLMGRQADELLERFDIGTIRQQLSWLPYRHAKQPDRLLVAAIEGRYDAPAAWHATKREGNVHPQETPLPPNRPVPPQEERPTDTSPSGKPS